MAVWGPLGTGCRRPMPCQRNAPELTCLEFSDLQHAAGVDVTTLLEVVADAPIPITGQHRPDTDRGQAWLRCMVAHSIPGERGWMVLTHTAVSTWQIIPLNSITVRPSSATVFVASQRCTPSVRRPKAAGVLHMDGHGMHSWACVK